MYFDHNSGCRVRSEVADRLGDWLRSPVANPSSLHRAGQRARAAVEEARGQVAALVGAEPAEVIFTSGGTEANNLALLGVLSPASALVTTPFEHASVLRCANFLESRGSPVSWLPGDDRGRVTVQNVARAVGANTGLVSIGWANGEIGTVQPVSEIVEVVRARAPHVLLHSDAVQAVAQLEVNMEAVGVDLLSLSAHKLGAPAGVGALVVRSRVELDPITWGGPQERERRAGTENVPGIVAFGLAAQLAAEERRGYAERAQRLKTLVWRELQAGIEPIVRLDGPGGLPGTLAISVPGLRGDALAAALDLRGVAVSTGSACAAGAPEPSHVLRAVGASDDVARGALRLSFGPELTEPEARRGAELVVEVVQAAQRRLRARRGSGIDNAA